MTSAVVDALDLRDIHLPASPELWPPAWGWWLLAAVILALLLVAFVHAWRFLARKRRTGRLLRRLRDVRRRGDLSETARLAELSGLLRRIALTHHPRRDIASLTGTDWLAFLDASGGAGEFVDGPGQVLDQGPYAPRLAASVDWTALYALAERWIVRQIEGPDAA